MCLRTPRCRSCSATAAPSSSQYGIGRPHPLAVCASISVLYVWLLADRDREADIQRASQAADDRVVVEAAVRARIVETAAPRQVTGVAPITALTFVLTVEDPSRGPQNRAVLARLPRARAAPSATSGARVAAARQRRAAGDSRALRRASRGAGRALLRSGP